MKVIHSPASVPLGFWLLWEWTPFILFLLEIPERKLAMLFQCLAKLLTWNCFWRCAIGIWLQVDRSHLPIFWFRAKLNATRDMIQSLQRLRESLPLSCKCAIGILFFWEWTPFILFLLEIPERKLAMLFQCLAKLLTWRCAIEIWLQVDRSHLPIFWLLA